MTNYLGKLIFILTSVLCVSLTGCSKDEINFDNQYGGESITFDLELSSSMVASTTRSTFATSEELQINHIIEAIYQTILVSGESLEKQIGLSEFSFENKQATTGIYKLENIPAKTGAVKIIVIANSDKTLNELEGLSSSAIKNLSVTNQTSTFSTSNLVKYGELDTELKADNQNVNIILTQLAARIDISISVNHEEWSYEWSDIKVDGINLSSDLFLNEYSINNYTYNTQKNNIGTIEEDVKNNSFTFYTYEKETEDSPVTITIIGKLKRGTYERSGIYKITLDPTIKDQNNTLGLIHGNLYDVTGKISINDLNESTIIWEVKSFSPISVNIPDFE